MVSIPSLNYNASISSYLNMKKRLPIHQKLVEKYKSEGNIEQQERYENAIKDAKKWIPKFKQMAEKWMRIAGIPASKFGQILSPEEVKFYEKDRSGGTTGFPEDLFPKGLGLDTYS